MSGMPAPVLSEAERTAVAPYVTNVDRPVFALVNLPETVKGALFARYSRSAKPLRRLFLDEFFSEVGSPAAGGAVGIERAERLYARVFNEYGDDSVAQLGGVHLAVEHASNVLTKVLERGRLMAYLEQSTRYIPYTERQDGRWRYHVPREIDGHPIRGRYVETLDRVFEIYARWIDPMRAWFERKYPKASSDSDGVYRAAIRAKALDTLRGMLPAATESNVGMYGTGQSYEALILRMRAHPLAEVRETADAMLLELRKVIPAFLTRVDQPDRGGVWSDYLRVTRERLAECAERLDERAGAAPPSEEVALTDFDPDGEVKVVAAALYPHSNQSDEAILAAVRTMSAPEREAILAASVGDRSNRRHKPGRAFERTAYRFDIVTDYGAFRDLQRHRLLTIDWQPLTTRHGFTQPDALVDAGGGDDWREVMDRSAGLYDALRAGGLDAAAPYAVSMAYRIRFVMDMNAREAMHVIELRTAPAGHPAYRRVCQKMHRLIADTAGHPAIAAAMRFADHSDVELERLGEERRIERKKGSPPFFRAP
jgi:thymidylate synthase ThyX